MPALSIADEFAVQQGLSSSYELAHIKTLAALSSEPVERRHVDWVKVSERLLQFVRGRRGIHQEALGFGQRHKLLREIWPKVFGDVDDGGVRVGIPLVDVDRLLVVPDGILIRQRAGLLLRRGYEFVYDRLELVHLVDGEGDHPVDLVASHRRLRRLRRGRERDCPNATIAMTSVLMASSLLYDRLIADNFHATIIGPHDTNSSSSAFASSDRACRTLSEPAVHRSEQFASLLQLALVTPRSARACSSRPVSVSTILQPAGSYAGIFPNF